jgi:hypothetical protein
MPASVPVQGAAPPAAAAAAPARGIAGAGAEGTAADDAAMEEEEEEEAQQWTLAWPAMLGAFAAAGHVPERRWVGGRHVRGHHRLPRCHKL